jgi:hypothetical protein
MRQKLYSILNNLQNAPLDELGRTLDLTILVTNKAKHEKAKIISKSLAYLTFKNYEMH